MAGRGTDDQPDRLADAVADLYGRLLAEFTTARAERVKEARASGDRDAAAAIGKLAKPNVVAWLANQLARRHPAELAPLLDLGESLRQATADLDAAQLRELSKEQHRIVSALMGRARELAAAAGQAVSDSTARGLEDTLHAALADEQAAGQLIQGHLAVGLSRTGFPGIDSSAAEAAAAVSRTASTHGKAAAARPGGQPGSTGRQSATAASGGRRTTAGSGGRSGKSTADRQAEAARAAASARRQQLERARRAEADARAEAAEASQEQERTSSALAAAENAARETEATISRLQGELDAALDARNSAGRAKRQARTDSDRADRSVRQADRRLTEATDRRKDLERDA